MDVNKRFAEFREYLGLNQSRLAMEIGVTQTAISNYESNYKIPEQTIIIMELKYQLNRSWLETGTGDILLQKNGIIVTRHEAKREIRKKGQSIEKLIDQNQILIEQVSDMISMQKDVIRMQLINAEIIQSLTGHTIKTDAENNASK